MDLTRKIQKMAEGQGITHFGTANLLRAHDFILEQGGPAVAEFPKSISLGITLPDTIVDQLPRRTDRAVALSYRHHAYTVINQRLDLTARSSASIFKEEAIRCYQSPRLSRLMMSGFVLRSPTN